MLDVKRTSRSKCFLSLYSATGPRTNAFIEVHPSRPSSLRSSWDDGPSKPSFATNTRKLRASSQSQTSSANLERRISIPKHASSPHIPQITPNSPPLGSLATAQAFPLASLQTSLVIPRSATSASTQHPSRGFSQTSSNISKPSPSFVAAPGEFLELSTSMGSNANFECIGQVDIDEGPRGSMNPHGLSLDKSTGYFPQGSRAVPGTIEDLLRMIAAERLHQMPQMGSNWDRSIRILESELSNPVRFLAIKC